MPDQPGLSILALALVAVVMVWELRLSRRHERRLAARGAVAPPDPVFSTMRWAYPTVFIAMAVEGALAPGAVPTALAGVVVFTLGKLLKMWAIFTLGERWTYRVFVLPGAPLIARGPYRLLRHPNYLGVLGELVGMALLVGARLTGPVGTAFFSWLLWRRISAEDRALQRR